MDIFEQTRIQSLHFVMYSIIFWAQIQFIIYEFSIYFFVHDKIIRRIANVNMFSLHIIFRAYKNVMMEWLVFKLYQNRYTIRYKMRLSIISILNFKLIFLWNKCTNHSFIIAIQMKLYYTSIFYSFNVPRCACCSNPFMLSE